MSPSARVKWIIGLPPVVTVHHMAVLIVLDSHADGRTGECRPKVCPTIMQEARVSERMVQRCINDLSEWGLIDVTRNPGRPTDYVVNWGAYPRTTDGGTPAPQTPPHHRHPRTADGGPRTADGGPRTTDGGPY